MSWTCATLGSTAARAVLDVLALWGGVDLRVPRSWNLNLDVTPIMGGAEDNRDTETPASSFIDDGDEPETITPGARDSEAPCLTIRGLALMGGVDVRS